ncbi:fluoride efflux transporter CrcB [Cellvibrio sp. ARAG 10.3]|uniref:fluoride efflux transporter CrcB n=1 Tax=Cellvibrio sp. ARAG 10.3 TaxID=3451358 RepID=UPI003F472F47
MQWLAVAVGGALGAMARYGVVSYLAPLTGHRFPLGTLCVNISGSFLIGVCYVVLDEKLAASPEWRLLTMTGFLGAFTTFSTFSLDALALWENGLPMTAVTYVLATVIGCLMAVTASVLLTQRLL